MIHLCANKTFKVIRLTHISVASDVFFTLKIYWQEEYPQLKDYRDCKCCLYISIKFLVQDRVQDKVGLRKFSPKKFFPQKALKCHVWWRNCEKKIPFKKNFGHNSWSKTNLSRISSVLF